MKKIFLAAAACLALFSCNNKTMETPKPDAIEVTPGSYTFGAEGGVADVIVTSNGDWTLEGKEAYNWVTPSVTSGKDGDVVTFTVVSNLEQDRTADFTFKSGIASAAFKVFSYAGEAPSLELKSEGTLSLGYEAEQIKIEVSTNKNHYRDVEYKLSEGAAEWLTYRATLPGETEADAELYFDAAALEGLADREATITVEVPGIAPVEVNLTQYAKHVLSTPTANYTIAVEGESIVIPLSANVAYDIVMEGAEGWLTVGEPTAEGLPFTAAALADGKRAATVTFTQTDAVEGETPLTCTIKITQVNALITWAADMTGNRLFPKWDGTGGGIAKNNDLTEATLECMVKFDDFNKASGGIYTIMGIEGYFLLRMGDVGNPLTRLQVATMDGNYNVPFDCQANTWYHLAVVWKERTAYVYFNGELKGTSQQFAEYKYVGWPVWNYVYLNPLALSPAWSYEPDGNRCFWMGYSYDANRDIHGLMTEIRLWNRALTAEEINAPNHFYTVDPASEGLFSYWKFTEGEGATVADKTANGNTLYGETNVRKQGNDNKGDAGISWVEVALPDK